MLENVEFDLVTFLGFVIIALIFVLLNGFFVAAEFALVGVRRSKIEELAQKGSGRAKAVLQAIDHQDMVISATQLGITLASLALGFVAGSYFEPVIEGVLDSNFKILASITAFSFGALIAIALTTYAHVVIGELVFKSIALQYPENTSMWVAKPLSFFTKIAKPLIILFNGTAWLILRLFGMEQIQNPKNIHSEDELKLIISQSQEAGVLDEHETEILSRTFDLSDTLVREIMTPRTELVIINVNENFENILDKILDSGHSRFPVYEETPDNIIGFIYAKDFLQYFKFLINGNNKEEFDPDIREILREADFVPETMHADKVLEQMQNSKKQVAIVISEFGGVAGLISLEDVLELLVGDIQDEYDIEPPDILPTEDGDIINGTMSLDDFNDHYKTNFESGHSVTFSGYVIEKFGRIPKENEEIVLVSEEEAGKYAFHVKVLHVVNNRINSLLITKLDKKEEEDNEKGKGKTDENGVD